MKNLQGTATETTSAIPVEAEPLASSGFENEKPEPGFDDEDPESREA